MAYTPYDWHTGEVITEERLDHIEQGIANAGVFFIHIIDSLDATTLDKNFAEIKTAVDNGMLPVVESDTSEGDTTNILYYRVGGLSHFPDDPDNPACSVSVPDYIEPGIFIANSPTGVLTHPSDGGGGGDIG